MDHGNTRRAAVLGLLLALGCGKSNTEVEQSAAATGPDQAVAQFLEAVRTGNDVKAAGMLTPLARKMTDQNEMVVAPPGSDTARFTVCDVELVDGGAHVATDWTDLDGDGRPHTDRIVWIMRKEPEGWRIAGMATKVFADRDAIILNFEDPQDMMRQQQLAEEEIARRERNASPPDKGRSAEPGRSVR